MAANYGITWWDPPRDHPPLSVSPCRYGKWFGRAVRDVEHWALNRWVGSVAVIYVLGVVSGIIVVAEDTPAWIKALAIVGVISLGISLVVVAVSLWNYFSPTSWKRHWVAASGPLTAPIPTEQREMAMTHGLISKHWHYLVDLRCAIRDPDSAVWEARWRYEMDPGDFRVSSGWVGPDEWTPAFHYPEDFVRDGERAPWPKPRHLLGDVVLGCRGGGRRARLARYKWKLI